jgi:hypothetical protein
MRTITIITLITLFGCTGGNQAEKPEPVAYIPVSTTGYEGEFTLDGQTVKCSNVEDGSLTDYCEVPVYEEGDHKVGFSRELMLAVPQARQVRVGEEPEMVSYMYMEGQLAYAPEGIYYSEFDDDNRTVETEIVDEMIVLYDITSSGIPSEPIATLDTFAFTLPDGCVVDGTISEDTLTITYTITTVSSNPEGDGIVLESDTLTFVEALPS